MKRTVLIGLALIAGVAFFLSPLGTRTNEDPLPLREENPGITDSILGQAYSHRQSDVQVSGQGFVTTLLPDDTSGSRHQKFIIRLASGQTLLIAHNIDLAPRIDALMVGDRVAFYGEYEWNDKGGVIHWTHRDPNGAHADGWLEHEGRRYR